VGLVAVLAAAVGVVACGHDAGKSGGRAERPVTLTFEMPDAGDAVGTAFAADVARRSGGSVHVRLGRAYDNAVPANELRLARALQQGRAQAGYLAARAWAAAGIPAFEALLAPFAVTTGRAAAALASGHVAQDVLAQLPHTVVGLALVPDEPRRVLAIRAPLAPKDFAGLRLRIVDNPESAAALQALGARAVRGMTARQAAAALRNRRIDGVESAPKPIITNSYWNNARHLSGYALFPKFQSIVVNRGTWDRLSDSQQEAVHKAARDAVRTAPGTVATQERRELTELCQAGVRVAVPTATQLAALSQTARRTTEQLAKNAEAAAVLDATGRLPGAGPHRLATPLPAACTTAGAAPGDRSAHSATIPEGVYVTKVTAEQQRAAGVVREAGKDLTFTTWLRNGRWTQTQTPTYPDQCAEVRGTAHPACTGTYQVYKDEATFVWDSSAPPPIPAPDTVKWTYFKGVLRFKPVNVTDPGDLAVFGQPWRKIR
jgi:TRAP-type C4-dicarboxylate transport system substrate-binding protein